MEIIKFHWPNPRNLPHKSARVAEACGNRWELNIPKPFLKPGAFHLQQIQTVSTVKLERRLGELAKEEMLRVTTPLKERLNL